MFTVTAASTRNVTVCGTKKTQKEFKRFGKRLAKQRRDDLAKAINPFAQMGQMGGIISAICCVLCCVLVVGAGAMSAGGGGGGGKFKMKMPKR